jgi:hypothetical protein
LTTSCENRGKVAQSSKDVAEAVEADVDGFEDIKSAMNIIAFLVGKRFWVDFPCLPNR